MRHGTDSGWGGRVAAVMHGGLVLGIASYCAVCLLVCLGMPPAA